jgi:hypothetical protein
LLTGWSLQLSIIDSLFAISASQYDLTAHTKAKIPSTIPGTDVRMDLMLGIAIAASRSLDGYASKVGVSVPLGSGRDNMAPGETSTE